MEDNERKRFDDAFARFERGTLWSSSLTEIEAHPARAELKALGPGIVPLLLEELRHKPSVGLFTLLAELSGEDPAYGETTVKGAAKKWLAWGSRATS